MVNVASWVEHWAKVARNLGDIRLALEESGCLLKVCDVIDTITLGPLERIHRRHCQVCPESKNKNDVSREDNSKCIQCDPNIQNTISKFEFVLAE